SRSTSPYKALCGTEGTRYKGRRVQDNAQLLAISSDYRVKCIGAERFNELSQTNLNFVKWDQMNTESTIFAEIFE
ncbi:hypothetical protein J6590_103566, partial [Homalodisca vitripennis]